MNMYIIDYYYILIVISLVLLELMFRICYACNSILYIEEYKYFEIYTRVIYQIN